jgi:hypothetical protein
LTDVNCVDEISLTAVFVVYKHYMFLNSFERRLKRWQDS